MACQTKRCFTSPTIKGIAILGGGPAGLAVGYYSQKAHIPFTVFESGMFAGGNSMTLQSGGFRFDSGAHRLHAKDSQVISDVQALLGDQLKIISMPSKIFYRGSYIHFPLSPFDLLNKIGFWPFSRAVLEVIAQKIRPNKTIESFYDYAVGKYGETIAQAFLLNYTEKLWGCPCHQLSKNIAGSRMKSLNIGTFIREAIMGDKGNSAHFEGDFYYPDRGIGTIMDALASACGHEHLRYNAKIKRLFHHNNKIDALEINGSDRVNVEHVVSSLSITDFCEMLDPLPPVPVINAARALDYRNIMIIAIFINRPHVFKDIATVYFPDEKYPYTRISEPKNRSAFMSPPDQTSLLVEIPYRGNNVSLFKEDQDNKNLLEMVYSQLIDIGCFTRDEILGAHVHRMINAYPVLSVGYARQMEIIANYLSSFTNLQITGRNGCFQYSWIHNMLQYGREIVDDIVNQRPSRVFISQRFAE